MEVEFGIATLLSSRMPVVDECVYLDQYSFILPSTRTQCSYPVLLCGMLIFIMAIPQYSKLKITTSSVKAKCPKRATVL